MIENIILGGLRHANLFIEGDSALLHLRQESGVHRVQRVPTTEKSGRIHTSTVAVAVLPQLKEVLLFRFTIYMYIYLF